jgi:hypothetical protein
MSDVQNTEVSNNTTQESQGDATENSTVENLEKREVEHENKSSNEIPEEYQKQVGAIAKAERAKMKSRMEALERHYQQRIADLSNQSAQNQDGMIVDPETGRRHPIDSPVGQMLTREAEVYYERERQKQKNQEIEEQQKAQEFQDKILDGHSRFTNYSDTLKTFVDLGTDDMARCLQTDIDDVPKLINYLGSKPEECKRIAQLSPAKQRRELYAIEDKLTVKKKLISNAPEPVKPVNQLNSPRVRAEDQSISDRVSYYRNLQKKRKT